MGLLWNQIIIKDTMGPAILSFVRRLSRGILKSVLWSFMVYKVVQSHWVVMLLVVVVFLRLCATYPKLLIVPQCISDEELALVSRFRMLGRFPVVVWRYM